MWSVGSVLYHFFGQEFDRYRPLGTPLGRSGGGSGPSKLSLFLFGTFALFG